VTLAAAYTKNGDPATLPLPSDLADDLAAYVATLPPGEPVFPLPPDCGAKMFLPDLERAGIPYHDASGLVFDFHALRCQCATLADQAGVTPRVVQKLMRHSTLELTGRYTRPRVVDLIRAAESLPSLRPGPADSNTSALARTGTEGAVAHRQPSEATGQLASEPVQVGAEGRPISKGFALPLPYAGPATGRDLSHPDVIKGEDTQGTKQDSRRKKPCWTAWRERTERFVFTLLDI
jgi:hypothetical protein